MTKAKTKSEAKPAQETSPSPKSKPMPAGMHTVTPHIICAGAAEAIEFYHSAPRKCSGCRARTAS